MISMKRLHRNMLLAAAWLALALPSFAPFVHGQGASATASSDSPAIRLSDPSRRGTVKVNLINGSITVKGYGGKDVQVDVRDEEGAARGKAYQDSAKPRSEKENPKARGLTKIQARLSELVVVEEDNTVTIHTDMPTNVGNLEIRVPFKTNLNLKTITGNIRVAEVEGYIEANTINGLVALDKVSGGLVAHALNGEVKAVLAGAVGDKPMSFSSLNGDIDVTMPSNMKASLAMQSFQGDVFSDFDIKFDAQKGRSWSEENRGGEGKRRIVRTGGVTRGSIGGGGAQIQFNTFNGSIYIRKGRL